jgi:acyl-CoA thioesterase II
MPPHALVDQPSILDLLNLERLEGNLYRNRIVFERPFRLYGGQVAAQALFVAGGTVPDGRVPHSLHGYFLRGGNTAKPTVFQVERDRDGRSFSARRVLAIQDGEVIFNMSASFAEPRAGMDGGGDTSRDPHAGDALPPKACGHGLGHGAYDLRQPFSRSVPTPAPAGASPAGGAVAVAGAPLSAATGSPR